MLHFSHHVVWARLLWSSISLCWSHCMWRYRMLCLSVSVWNFWRRNIPAWPCVCVCVCVSLYRLCRSGCVSSRPVYVARRPLRDYSTGHSAVITRHPVSVKITGALWVQTTIRHRTSETNTDCKTATRTTEKLLLLVRDTSYTSAASVPQLNIEFRYSTTLVLHSQGISFSN